MDNDPQDHTHMSTPVEIVFEVVPLKSLAFSWQELAELVTPMF